MSKDPSRLRPSRISDMRKAAKQGEEWKPSVTTVIDVLDKGGLTNWKIDQHLEQAWHLTRESNLLESYPDFNKEIKRLTELQMDKAPSKGTDFHKLMEDCSNKDGKVEGNEYEICRNTWEVVIHHTLLGMWKSEVNFVFNGYGGQVDLFGSGVEGDDWLIDYKTKQTADKFKPGKMVYDNHRMQLAAYRQAVNPTARCANVFVCLEDGQIDFHEIPEKELVKGWKLFEHALGIWWIQHEPI